MRYVGHVRIASVVVGACVWVLMCGMSGDVRVAHAGPVPTLQRLRVRGVPRVDGHAGRTHGNVLVEGRVLDDAGSPVPSAALTIALQAKIGGLLVSPEGQVTTACGDAQKPATLSTDESGRFCVWIGAPMGAYSVHVEVAASEWLSRAVADYEVDLAKRSVELRFDPEPRIVTLDADAAPLDAVATYDDAEADHGTEGPLSLELSTEAGDVIARASTRTGGRATFAVDPHKLGPPGKGVLRVRFAGDADTMASEHVAPIERDAHVTLELAHEVAAASPEDGVPIEVMAHLKSPLSNVVSGSVQARVDGVIVGAAALENGRTTLHATFVARTSNKVSHANVQLRYVADVPWLQDAGDLVVVVPLRGPSPWRQAPLALGALAVAAWLLLGRSARRVRLDRTLVMQRPPTHEGTAGISVVHSSRSRVGKFGGKVVDAHDGSPIARARLAVAIPGFHGDSVIVSVFADEQGAFEFELTQAPPDADLVVEAPLHTELRQKLPGAGVLEVALVSRRRKLLERLVQWAKRRGPPFDVRPEPTPAQVRRAAEGAMPGAAEWAGAIERAAFDKEDVDARVESDVMALEPERGHAPGGKPPHDAGR